MELSVFQFDDYKAYLEASIQGLPRRGYGFKSRIAEAMGCKTAYVAQVLGGSAHFSLEQAESLNTLLKHSDPEGEFFLLLVQLARAGTEKLRQRFRSQIEAQRARHSNLKHRFRATTTLEERDLYAFFGVWYFNAIQLAASIPRLRDKSKLMSSLGLSEELVNEALEFLMSRGLIEESKGRLVPGQTRVFIGKDSPILKAHHANWRAKAVQSLDQATEKDLHFTSVYSLSAKDAARIRERLVREIEAVRAIVKDSPEEQLSTLTLDFFRVDR
jgi:uncharacterized protein (TIGR02147 family)